jgi:hypothetical protein
MRDSMVFYRSFFEAIKDLNYEQQGIIFNAIFDYGLNFKEPKLEGICKTIWTLIKPQLDANIKKFHNGKQPKEKQIISKTEANNKQKESKLQANVNANVNDNDNDKLLGKPKPRKISFEESNLFDKISFKETFPDWSQDKLRHYYDAALRYSVEGNKYVSWELAIKQWERKDKINNVLVEKPQQKVIIW